MIDSLLFLGLAHDPQTRIEMIQLDTQRNSTPFASSMRVE